MARVLEKRLGALPVVAQFGRRLRIAEVVDELCPVREVAPISHGEVIEALVANRLTAPAPLVQVEAWAAAMAVDEVYGIEPHLLNDDRLGRALDAIAPHLDEVIGSVGAAAISEFGVDVARLHWDMTSISLYGAYPDADEEYPAPRWGHPKDRRPDLKQVQAGLAVAGDGGIPVFHRAYDGGAGEVAQVTGAMTALKKIAGPCTFLLVGDSKLISYANAAAMAAAQVAFVAPLAAARVPAGLFAALPAGAGTEVDYTARRDAGKPAAARASYRVAEDDGMDLRGPRKSDPVVHLRRILVYSSANAAGQAKARALKLAQAAGEMDKLVRTAGTRFHPDAGAVAARVQAIAAKRRVGKYLRTIITAGSAGKPVLAWHFDQNAIDAEAAADGWYALLTNLAPSHRQPGRGLPPLQGPARRRTPLRGVQGPPRGRPDLPGTQPAHHRPDHRDLPGPADFLPGRAAGPPGAGPARRDDDRPARLRPRPRPPHRQDHLPRPGRPAPDPRPRRLPRHHPQTRRRPSPAPRPAQHRYPPAPLAQPVKPHVRRTGLEGRAAQNDPICMP